MDRQPYIDRVVARLNAILAEETRLPCPFNITGGQTVQSDAPITVYLRPASRVDGIYETEEVFAEIQAELNTEFKMDPCYFGIFVAVPHEFLGMRNLNAFREQRAQDKEDYERFRRVRLKELP